MVKSDNRTLNLSLTSPKKKTSKPTATQPGVTNIEGKEFDSFEVTNPESGNWTISLANTTAPTGKLGKFSKKEVTPLPILDNSSVTSSIEVASTGIVSGLQVGVNINHTFRSDLKVTLISPAGTRIWLQDKIGGSYDDVIGTYGVDLTSLEGLNSASGESAAGNWQLEVKDVSSGNEGRLNSWYITFVPASAAPMTKAEVSITTQNNELLVTGKASHSSITYPAPIHLSSHVTAYGAAVIGVNVYADVYTPDGGHLYLPMYDDGRADHGDDVADDGSYNVLFDSYTKNGVYNFVINAVNKTGRAVSDADVIPGELAPSVTSYHVPTIPPFERAVSAQCTVRAVPAEHTQQFSVDYLSMKDNANPKLDSFEISGNFYAVPIFTFDGKTSYYFKLANSYVVYTLFSSNWKRVGRYQRYTQKGYDYSAYFSYFIGGSSKCSYSYKKNNTLLNLDAATLADLKVTMSDLVNWTDSVNVQMDSVGSTVRRYSGKHSQLDLFVSSVGFNLSTSTVGSDSMTFSARAEGPFLFDPAVHGIQLTVGPFTLSVSPGSFTQKKTVLAYRGTTAFGGSIVITYDVESQLLRATVSKADFKLVAAQPWIPIKVELTGVAGASWQRSLGLSANKSLTSFRY